MEIFVQQSISLPGIESPYQCFLYIFYDYRGFESQITVIFFRFVFQQNSDNAKSSIFHKPDSILSLILPTQHKSMKYL